jgi:hypothetical protein
MAILIGGVEPLLGLNNRIAGTADPDLIFGDPYTTGVASVFAGLPGFEDILEVGGALSSGRGGNDHITSLGGFDEVNFLLDIVFGDAFEINGTGRGGNDHIVGGEGGASLIGDAWLMSDDARGGNDQIEGGAGGFGNDLVGDAGSDMSGNARGGKDVLTGGTDGNSMYGDAGSLLSDNTRGGNDRIVGGAGSDFVVGEAFNLEGNARGGDDWIDVGDGDDRVVLVVRR